MPTSALIIQPYRLTTVEDVLVVRAAEKLQVPLPSLPPAHVEPVVATAELDNPCVCPVATASSTTAPANGRTLKRIPYRPLLQSMCLPRSVVRLPQMVR